MKLESILITHIRVHPFKSFNREKSTQDEKVRFIKGNELKLTRVNFLLYFIKKSGLNPNPSIWSSIACTVYKLFLSDSDSAWVECNLKKKKCESRYLIFSDWILTEFDWFMWFFFLKRKSSIIFEQKKNYF